MHHTLCPQQTWMTVGTLHKLVNWVPKGETFGSASGPNFFHVFCKQDDLLHGPLVPRARAHRTQGLRWTLPIFGTQGVSSIFPQRTPASDSSCYPISTPILPSVQPPVAPPSAPRFRSTLPESPCVASGTELPFKGQVELQQSKNMMDFFCCLKKHWTHTNIWRTSRHL